ncbi:uncharacterized protein LOC143852323 [Tasmannia lanceolata]|uniref:uncharacterized protein LOC143852323 n=1 Tax=Tasmannia lanceolata TaxID=3420 RepID=UPI00406405C2
MGHCLVGFLIGRRPYFMALKDHLLRKWQIKGEFKISALNHGFFLFKFNNSEDCSKILEMGTHSFGGRPQILQRWYLDMPLIKPNLASIPVWVRLPDLHLQFWTQRGIRKIDSGIGKPLYMDTSTAEGSRLLYARFCVEIDVDALPLPDSIDLQTPSETITQQIEYDQRPSACLCCRDFSLTNANCPKSNTQQTKKPNQEWKKTPLSL